MLHYRVRQAQIALGVFEVDRVHFVRHGRRANLARNGLLFEMVQRHITPDITIEINQDGVKAGDAVEHFGNIVVRLNLGGVRVPGDPQRGDEVLAQRMPVHFGIGGNVGVVIPYSAVDFAQYFNLLQLT